MPSALRLRWRCPGHERSAERDDRGSWLPVQNGAACQFLSWRSIGMDQRRPGIEAGAKQARAAIVSDHRDLSGLNRLHPERADAAPHAQDDRLAVAGRGEDRAPGLRAYEHAGQARRGQARKHSVCAHRRATIVVEQWPREKTDDSGLLRTRAGRQSRNLRNGTYGRQGRRRVAQRRRRPQFRCDRGAENQGGRAENRGCALERHDEPCPVRCRWSAH